VTREGNKKGAKMLCPICGERLAAHIGETKILAINCIGVPSHFFREGSEIFELVSRQYAAEQPQSRVDEVAAHGQPLQSAEGQAPADRRR